tara:strand:- start:2533 stop:3045 length:513 start_codon:yes stop_codon:yes gene_type:complete
MDGERVLKIVLSPDDEEWESVRQEYRTHILRTDGSLEDNPLMAGLRHLFPTEREADADVAKVDFYSFMTDLTRLGVIYDGVRAHLLGKVDSSNEDFLDNEADSSGNDEPNLKSLENMLFPNKSHAISAGIRAERELVKQLYEGNKVVVSYEVGEDFPGCVVDFRTEKLEM